MDVDDIPGWGGQLHVLGAKPTIHFRQFEGEQETRITLQFKSRGKPVFLVGIRALESRPVFWTVSIPPLEHWDQEIQQLKSSERRALQEAEFYHWLRSQIEERLRRTQTFYVTTEGNVRSTS